MDHLVIPVEIEKRASASSDSGISGLNHKVQFVVQDDSNVSSSSPDNDKSDGNVVT